MTTPIVVQSPGSALAAAQQAALAQGPGIDRLYLNPVARGVPGLDVANSIVAARVLLTIEGASWIDITINDPDWLIERSELLNIDTRGRMPAINVTLDGLAFRLVKASRQVERLTLTFEDLVIALLREHNKPKSWSRNTVTRGQAIEQMVREVKETFIPFFSPEGGLRQPIARPDFPTTAPSSPDTGFDTGVKLKIKGQTANAQQMRELATALGVADQENAPPRARMAMLVAGIGESSFQAVPNAEGSGYEGVFQADPKKIPRKDTEQQARSFLRGGKGFQGGGAIALASSDAGLSAGAIATTVEAGGEAPSFYDKWHDEAKAILAAYSAGASASGSSGRSSSVLYAKQFKFTRGQGAQRETSWDAMTRLAGDVQWRVYAAGGVVVFAQDDYLITLPASIVLDDPLSDGVLQRPSYDWDHGKPVGTVELDVIAPRWSVVPGGVVALTGQRWGPIAGRWLVLEVDQNLLDRTDCTVTLTKPMPALLEPATDVTPRPASVGSATGGAALALAWARGKIGHFKEEFTNNRGAELDRLEGQFNMVGQAWCAMFATTAVAQGAGDSVKTASVAQIRAWALEGSHGYTRGFRRTALPGDLLLIGDQHVALIEKVTRQDLKTIEGNTSANKVAALTRLASEGDIVRPDYRS